MEPNGGTAGISPARQFSQVIDRRRLDGVWLGWSSAAGAIGDELLQPRDFHSRNAAPNYQRARWPFRNYYIA